MSFGSMRESFRDSGSDASVGAVAAAGGVSVARVSGTTGCIDSGSSGGTGDGDGLCASLWLINTGSSSDIFAIPGNVYADCSREERTMEGVCCFFIIELGMMVDQPSNEF